MDAELSNPYRQEIQHAVNLLLKTHYAIVLTGAGISTESGIPDFRGSGGIWDQFSPTIYGNIRSFRKSPQLFWKMAKQIAPALLQARPNPGHYALAEFEKLNLIQCIITKNIDGLHQQAGSRCVYEVHGSLRRFNCMDCTSSYPQEYVVSRILTGMIPKCNKCGSYLKPDVVLFGESLPIDQIQKSLKQAHQADLILVAGSALEVSPVNILPTIVLEKGGKLIIVNDTSTWLDDKAEIIIHHKTGIILPKILEEVKNQQDLRISTE